MQACWLRPPLRPGVMATASALAIGLMAAAQVHDIYIYIYNICSYTQERVRGVEIAVKALVSGQALLLGMAPQKEKEKKEKKKKKEKKEPAREEGESSEDKTIPSPKPAEPAKESKAKESKETDEKETDEKKQEGHSSGEESYSTDKAAKAADLRKKALAELHQQKPAEPS